MAKTTTKVMLTSQAVSEGVTATTGITVGRFKEASVYIQMTAKSGTTPTFNADAQVSHDNVAWHKHTALTEVADPDVTSPGKLVDVVGLTNISDYLRLNITITGSVTPTITMIIRVVLKD